MPATGARTGYSKVRLHIGSYLFLLPSQQTGIAACAPAIIATAAALITKAAAIIATAAQSPFTLVPTTAGGS